MYARRNQPRRLGKLQRGFIALGLPGVGPAFGGGRFNPQQLFANGEQGAWYDPSDFSTMYQDSAGTTPVTAVGQPVGLMLDKRLGAVRGAELSTIPDATVTGGGRFAEQANAVEAGKFYEITFSYTCTSGINLRLNTQAVNGAESLVLWALVTDGTTQALRGIFKATDTYVAIEADGALFTGTISNVSFKSLAGNHATQATAASRPTLSGRYNLLTYSEQFDNAAWTKDGTAVVTANAGTAPDGTLTADRIAGATGAVLWGGGNSVRSASATLTASTSHRGLIYFKSDGATTVQLGLRDQSTGDITTTTLALTSEWQAVTHSKTTGAATTALGFLIGAADGNVLVWGADLRLSADASLAIPAYQRVTTATDYDTAGFPLYLSFDGVDDSLATASVDFSATDKMTVWAGVHKAAEALGMVYELGADVSSTDRTFNFYTESAGSAQYALRATVAQEASSIDAFAAPASVVSTAQYDLVGASQAARTTVRHNGASKTLTVVTGPTTTAGGGFANAPLYIGRRGGSSLPFNGRLYSLIVRGAATNSVVLNFAEKWIGQRMGVAVA